MIYVKLFIKLVIHKYFTFRAGLWTKAPLWNLIVHDLSKFSPSEFPHYAITYIAKKKDTKGYKFCWLNHSNKNKHHSDYWVLRPKSAYNLEWGPLPMPEKYVREMVADWLSACRTYQGYWPDVDGWPNNDKWSWMKKNYTSLLLHDITKERIKTVIDELQKNKSLRRKINAGK